jgi:hypothetical protein
MGAQLVKEAAIKTNDMVGDGTTTATVIAQAIVREGMKAIGSGGNPVLVKRGIDLAVGALVEHLQSVAHLVETEEDFAHVAGISANDDVMVGRVIARALHTVGQTGIVTVEEAAQYGMSVDFVEGFEFDNGFVSPYLVTDPGRLEAVLDDPYILITNEKITQVRDLMPLLDKIMRAPRPLLIIAENIEGTALSMLVHNHVNRTFQACAVRAPGFGDRRLHKLEDIAAITGGTVLSKYASFNLQTMGVEHLGRAEQVRVTDSSTAIVGGAGTAENLGFRITQLRSEMGRAQYGVDEDVLAERIGALTGKIAVIRVGAPTNAELKELQHRVEDALSACRAAMAEGIVAGGGRAGARREGAGCVGPQGRLCDRRGHRAPVAHRAGLPDRHERRLPRSGGGGQGAADGRGDRAGRRLRRPGGPLREHDRDGHHRPAAGGPLRAAERRLGGRAAAHHELAGRRGADAVGRQRLADDRVRPAGRGAAAALARLEHAAVAGTRPGDRLTGVGGWRSQRSIASHSCSDRPWRSMQVRLR